MTRYEARVESGGMVTRLGTFPTPAEAVAYLADRLPDPVERATIERVETTPDIACYICGRWAGTDCSTDCPNTEGRFAWTEGRDA